MDLGTEATRAGIIELLFKRGFLTKKGRNIRPRIVRSIKTQLRVEDKFTSIT